MSLDPVASPMGQPTVLLDDRPHVLDDGLPDELGKDLFFLVGPKLRRSVMVVKRRPSSMRIGQTYPSFTLFAFPGAGLRIVELALLCRRCLPVGR